MNPLKRKINGVCRDFLIQSPQGFQYVPSPSLITVHEDSDFGDVLRALVFGGVHHVFVLDLEGSPLRVLTPTDILQRIALPSAQKIGWRFDSYEIHPDSFRDRRQTV